MKRFQNGGLAEVASPTDEELEATASRTAAVSALPTQQIVERTTGVRPGMSLSDLILQNKEANLQRLRMGRENLSARRVEARRQEDKDRWLAFAQAMLTPTRTGGFGESLGMAAGQLRQESARGAAAEAQYDAQLQNFAMQEIEAENNMIDQMLKDANVATNRSKGIHGSIQTMVHPNDQSKDPLDQRIIFGAVMRDPDDPTSAMALRPLENPDRPGSYFEAASKLDPARANALVRATENAEHSTARSEQYIKEAIDRRRHIRDIRDAITLLESNQQPLSTSGLQQLKNRMANFVGVDLGDTTELTMVQALVARDFLEKLADLKGPASDRDMAAMQAISVNIGQNTEFNYQQLRRMADIYEGALSRGVREAWYASSEATIAPERRAYMDVVGDLWESVANNPWVPGAVPVKSEADVAKLNVGDPFFEEGDWGGIIYRKKAPEQE